MVFHGTCKAHTWLVSFDKATRGDHVLRSTLVLLHIKLVVHDVLVVHRVLKLKHLSLLDKSR